MSLPNRKSFTIYRDRWIRGEERDEEGARQCNVLYRVEDCCACAMGHYLLACDFTPRELAGRLNPGEIVVESSVGEGRLEIDELDDEVQWIVTADDDGDFVDNDSEECSNIMETNDRGITGVEPEDRENRLIECFADLHVDLTFEDTCPEPCP